jgi:hypothetical protein
MSTMPILTLVLALANQSAPAAPAPGAAHALTLEFAVPMPLVQGRMDHLAFDAKRNVVYVAALANDTLESIDLEARKVLAPQTGLSGPAGVVYVPESDEVIVANGGTGDLDVIRRSDATESASGDKPGDPPKRKIDKAIEERSSSVRKVHVGADVDNVRFDPVTKRLLVGFGSGSLALVRTDAWLVSGLIDLGDHPESFQVRADGKRAWINVPGKQQVAVADLVTNRVEKWIDLKAAKQNYPMALDEADKRLLIGCRDPGRLLVIDTESNTAVGDLPMSGDVDDVFCDTQHGLVFASCGEGSVDVFESVSPGVWKPKEKIATAPGARTCLFVPEKNRLIVAVPHRADQPAELRVYAVSK